MITLKLTFMTFDGNRVKMSIPIQIDEESLKKCLGENTTVPLNGIEAAALIID